MGADHRRTAANCNRPVSTKNITAPVAKIVPGNVIQGLVRFLEILVQRPEYFRQVQV